MSGTLPFPTDPESLAVVGIGLVGGLWLLIMKSGGHRSAAGPLADSDSSS